MSATVVVDASVAFRWFCQAGEDRVLEAFALLEAQALGDLSLHAPSSLHLELANALRYSDLPASRALEAIESLDLTHVELADMTIERLHAAASLAYRHSISVYDALFLALAEELDCPLVTADRRAFANIDSPVEIRLL